MWYETIGFKITNTWLMRSMYIQIHIPNKVKEFTWKRFLTCEKQWEYNGALIVKGHKYNFEIQIDACDVVNKD